MSIRTIAAALTLALLACAGAAQAQEYTGYPGSRVRMAKPEVIPAEEMYLQNRVIIRQTVISPVGAGMQISGEVVTDFDADRVPPEKTNLPRGQMMGIKVNVELYYWDTVIERDSSRKARYPQLDPLRKGALVEGQSVTVTVDQSFERFGLAKFTLPALTKPLAPGVYRLFATVRFLSQDAKITEAVKYCSDMYGSYTEVDANFQVIFKPIMQYPEKWQQFYNDLVNITGVLKDETVIWIGEIYTKGELRLIPPEKATAKVPANHVIWGYHMEVIKQVQAFQYQLENVDKLVEDELAAKLKAEPKKNAKPEELEAFKKLQEMWKEQAKNDKARIIRENTAQLEKFGGKLIKDRELNEVALYTSGEAARLAVLEQVANFHEYLSRCYWVLSDGYLKYTGWDPVYSRGYHASDAIGSKDIKKRSAARKTALAAADPNRWATRKEQWKYMEPAIYTAWSTHFKAYEESDAYDAEKFVSKVGAGLELDSGKWGDFRTDFVVDFYEKSNEAFKQVTSTEVYAVQVWPQALNQLISARDDIIALTFSWEYYIRKTQMGETVENIQKSWTSEAGRIAAVSLTNYHGRGKTDPGNLLSRFDASRRQITTEAALATFISVYSNAVRSGVDPKNLPGIKPPSGW